MFLMLKMCLDKVSDVDIKFHKFMFAERCRYAAVVQRNKSSNMFRLKILERLLVFLLWGTKVYSLHNGSSSGLLYKIIAE